MSISTSSLGLVAKNSLVSDTFQRVFIVEAEISCVDNVMGACFVRKLIQRL